MFIKVCIESCQRIKAYYSTTIRQRSLSYRGACGEVKLAFAKGSCKKYAVKIVQTKKFTVGGKNKMVSQKPIECNAA